MLLEKQQILVVGLCIAITGVAAWTLRDFFRGVQGDGRRGASSNNHVFQIQSTLPLGALTPMRLDPIAILASAQVKDPVLEAWVNNWEAGLLREEIPDPEKTAELPGILAKSPLPAVDMLALAHGYHFLSRDSRMSALIYEAASFRIETELNRPNQTPAQMRAVLLAIQLHIQDYKNVLWPLIEDRGDERYVKTLYRIYSSFVRCVPQDDEMLVKASRHPAIGAAECLYVLGKPTESLAMLEKMPSYEMTEGEKSAWAWAMALALEKLNRYPEAVPYFEIVAADSTNKYVDAAASLVRRQPLRVNKPSATDTSPASLNEKER